MTTKNDNYKKKTLKVLKIDFNKLILSKLYLKKIVKNIVDSL